ncbi:hypothetical protein BC629DRAFT_1725020 [Irpex lacteus]|nr:hypothetical protein BC629DRAFT_1725020 [Irpex lacteus]
MLETVGYYGGTAKHGWSVVTLAKPQVEIRIGGVVGAWEVLKRGPTWAESDETIPELNSQDEIINLLKLFLVYRWTPVITQRQKRATHLVPMRSSVLRIPCSWRVRLPLEQNKWPSNLPAWVRAVESQLPTKEDGGEIWAVLGLIIPDCAENQRLRVPAIVIDLSRNPKHPFL